MREAGDSEFSKLFPPVARADERAVLAFDPRVNRLVLTTLAIEFSIYSSIPRLVERRKLSVFDKRANVLLVSYCTHLLVVVSFVTEKNCDITSIPLNE